MNRATIIERLARARYDHEPLRDDWKEPLPYDEFAGSYRLGMGWLAPTVEALIVEAVREARESDADAIDECASQLTIVTRPWRNGMTTASDIIRERAGWVDGNPPVAASGSRAAGDES